MKRAAHLVLLCAFVAGVCGLALFASAAPLLADDCKQQVTKFTDLMDEKRLQDCLRTGSQYGRAIGTIVAVSGIAIAGAGLAGSTAGPTRDPKTTPPPEPGKDPALERNPCERMKLRENRLSQLHGERVDREAQIMQEWRSFMDTASFLQNNWRLLKNAQTRTYWAIVSARTANFAGLGVLLVGTIGAIKAGLAGMAAKSAAAAPAAAAVAPTFVESWAGAIGIAEGALGSVAAETLPSTVPGPKPFTDPFASEIGKTMGDALTAVVNQYRMHARVFNQAFAQWGINTQQDIAQLRSDMQTEIDQWRLDAAECPDASPPPPQPPQQDMPVTTLNVIRVPEDLGTTWIGGDWIRWGKGDLF